MKNLFRVALLTIPFALSACGEGYDMIRTDAMFPYGNQRTAGTGVAYVLAKMMPEKELVYRPVERTQAPKVIEKPVVKEVERVFKDAQVK